MFKPADATKEPHAAQTLPLLNRLLDRLAVRPARLSERERAGKRGGAWRGLDGASSAVCRYRYSVPPMIRLAKAGIESYRRWRDFTACSQPKAELRNEGVL